MIEMKNFSEHMHSVQKSIRNSNDNDT